MYNGKQKYIVNGVFETELKMYKENGKWITDTGYDEKFLYYNVFNVNTGNVRKIKTTEKLEEFLSLQDDINNY